ncbi:MAG TPA: hypothetical protein ENH01_00355 [Nitrospirae bacterium]|nr:hypothetical protein [Nitrospirota bacterium]
MANAINDIESRKVEMQGKRERLRMRLCNMLMEWAQATKGMENIVSRRYVWVTGKEQTLPSGRRRNRDIYLKVGDSELYSSTWESELPDDYEVSGRVEKMNLYEQRLDRLELLTLAVKARMATYAISSW